VGALVGLASVDWRTANLAGIGLGSMVRLAMSDRWVFPTSRA